MTFTNLKTGAIYNARTHTERGAFISVVTRRIGNTETVSSRERHPTRAKAYRYAITMAKSQSFN
jgi:hypothetical protein